VLILLALILPLLPGVTPLGLAKPVDPTAFDQAVSSAAEEANVAPPRGQILTYLVQPGDSLWSIAVEFDLDVDTLRWSNPAIAQNPDLLRPGQELVILPIRGVYVIVQPGDTVAKLAARWGVAPADIVNYPLNNLREGEEPRVGARLVIPHGRYEVKLAPPGPAPGYTYAWPIRGTITQRYSPGHRAVDFGAPYGAKVYAARAGRCVYADWSPENMYGYLVIVDHGDGSRAYYSHLKGAWVEVGEWVSRGDLVGEVGSTGNSTGPHVHFEIRVGGVPQNPLDYLPPEP
jgi:murein DD-endopeptidase MepM/ murein hydrolase activator NlpD